MGGYQSINIGPNHGDDRYPQYDLVFNKSVIGYHGSPQDYQCHCGQTCGWTYQVWWMWPTYVLRQFQGVDLGNVEDDFLYQVLRVQDEWGWSGQGMNAFYLVAQDYPAPPPWNYQNGTEFFRAIFNNWTIANLVDGTDFALYKPQYSYKLADANYNVPLWENDDGVAGMGWLRENEIDGDGSCNTNSDPNDTMGCSTWELPEVELPSPGVPVTYVLDGDGYGSAIIGIEVYAADYVKWVPSFSGDYILRLRFNVDRVDHGSYDAGDNILIQANAVQYVGDESTPISVNGALEAEGNAVLPITFTSAAAQPNPGDWVGIFSGGTDGTLIVRDCIVEYAQKGVAVANSQPHEIQNSQFRHCSQVGLWIKKYGADPVMITEPVTGNVFWANDYGAYLDGVTLTEFRGNSFDGNVIGMYMNQSRISDPEGFRDLVFAENDVGLKVETPAGGISTPKYSSFSGNADCAIYYNRNTGAGDLELQDLFIVDQTPVLNAGIRVLGSNSEPVVRDCHIHSFAGGPLAPNKGITCMSMGRVDAGTAGSPGGNRFEGNECDIEYTNRGYNPPWLHAVGNCWGASGSDPVFCGNQMARILWEPIDCSAWGGSPVPPRPAEETVAGLVGVFPNPAEGSFRVAYGMGTSERVKVQIYDLSGRLVRTVVESEMPAGTHEAEWDGTDAQGRAVGKGVYVCRIVGNSFVESKRLVVIR